MEGSGEVEDKRTSKAVAQKFQDDADERLGGNAGVDSPPARDTSRRGQNGTQQFKGSTHHARMPPLKKFSYCAYAKNGDSTMSKSMEIA